MEIDLEWPDKAALLCEPFPAGSSDQIPGAETFGSSLVDLIRAPLWAPGDSKVRRERGWLRFRGHLGQFRRRR